MRLTYSTGTPPISFSWSSADGTDQFGTAYKAGFQFTSRGGTLLSGSGALTTPTTVTMAAFSGLGVAANFTVPISDVAVGTTYKITCWGSGTQSTALTNLAIQGYLNQTAAPGALVIGGTGLGQSVLASAAMLLATFSWWAEMYVQIKTTGSGGTTSYMLRGSANQNTNALNPGTAADWTIPFSQQNNAVAFNTTIANVLSMTIGFSGTQAGQTLVCNGAVYEKIGSQ